MNIFIKKKRSDKFKLQIFKFANTTIIYMYTAQYIIHVKLLNIPHKYLGNNAKYLRSYSKLPTYITYDFITNFYTCNKLAFSKRLNKTKKLSEWTFKHLLWSTNFSFKAYARVRGIGYKFILQQSMLMAHLGYSHVNVINIPLSIVSKMSRKATKIRLQDKKIANIMLFRAKIRKLRPPDIYKGKGVRYRYEKYKLKEGKKKKTF